MSIQGVKENTVDWSKLLNSVQGEDGNSVKVGDGSRPVENLTVVELKENAMNLSFQPSTPELESANLSGGFDSFFENEENLRNISEKMADKDFQGLSFPNDFQEEPQSGSINSAKGAPKGMQGNSSVKDNLATFGYKGGKSGLVDIYTLTAFMLTCLQKRKNAERDIRKAEVDNVVNSIQNQAEREVDAAVTGLISGIIVGGLQITASAVQTIRMTQAATTQSSIAKECGVPEANAKVMDAQKQLDADLKQLNDLKGVDTKVASELKDLKGGVADNKLDNSLQSQLEGAQEGMKNNAQGEMKINLKDEANNPVNNESNPVNNENNPVNAENKNPVNDENVEKAENLPKEENGGKVDAKNAGDGKIPREGKIKELEKQVQQDREELAKATADHDNRVAAMKLDPAYIKAGQVFAKAQATMEIINGAGAIFRSVGDGATGYLKAQATKEGTQVELNREYLDQSKAMFSNSQETISRCINLFQEIISKDNQSVRDAIGNLS
ncbi:MAG: hypothetical protein MJ202_09570 [Lentisphaeria bacterium]|nr:hypothetical protein [Lentisphaeria bacterium]